MAFSRDWRAFRLAVTVGLALLAALLLARELVFHVRFCGLRVGDQLSAGLGAPDESFSLSSAGEGARTMLWRGTVLQFRWWADVSGEEEVIRKHWSCWFMSGAALSEDPPEPVAVSLLRFAFVIAVIDLIQVGWRRWRKQQRRTATG
jgi:hypothetical protein